MARKSKKQTGTKSSNESVIASRVLQDIINNSSESFRRYLESQGGGAQMLAGGSGVLPPSFSGYSPAMPQATPPSLGMAPMGQPMTVTQAQPQGIEDLMRMLGLI